MGLGTHSEILCIFRLNTFVRLGCEKRVFGGEALQKNKFISIDVGILLISVSFFIEFR